MRVVTQRRGFSAWVTSGETMTAEAFVWVSLKDIWGGNEGDLSVLASSIEATKNFNLPISDDFAANPLRQLL